MTCGILEPEGDSPVNSNLIALRSEKTCVSWGFVVKSICISEIDAALTAADW